MMMMMMLMLMLMMMMMMSTDWLSGGGYVGCVSCGVASRARVGLRTLTR